MTVLNGKKQLLFMEPISALEPDNKVVLEKLIKLLGQHGIEVIDDLEEVNEKNDYRGVNS